MAIMDFHGTSSRGEEVRIVYFEQRAARSAFAFAIVGDDLPRIVHWGRPLADPRTLVAAADALRPQRVSGALDETAWPSILPTQAEAWTGSPRFVVRAGGMELFCRFAVTDVRIDDDGVTVGARDAEQGVRILWRCELRESGLVRQRMTVVNMRSGELEIGTVELAFPVPADMTEILTTTGHHLRERSPQRQPFTIGRFQKASLVGRPDFDSSLLLNVGRTGFGFTHGEVYSVHVAWSGNSLMAAERLPYTSGLIGGAEALSGGEVTLCVQGGAGGDGARYTTPWLYGSYGEGLNEVAARFHTELRTTHAQWRAELDVPEKPRPVILNTWEAVYFQHDFGTLKSLADKAAASGVERFVVDDGWFGGVTTPRVWATGGSRRTCGRMETTRSRRSPTTCMPKAWNLACGSSPRW